MAEKKGGTPVVGIVMGSDSDLPVMKEAEKVLNQFHVPYEITLSSAHRLGSKVGGMCGDGFEGVSWKL